MVWRAISYARKTQLVPIQGNLNAARYRDEILQPHLLPAIDVRREIFQQDKARPHAARLTMDYLQNQNITVIPWPSKWPDLNPIEHLWDELDRRQPQILQALQQALQYEWQRIPQERIDRLIGSMSRRVRTVLQVNGGRNRYCI
jgi:transposase